MSDLQDEIDQLRADLKIERAKNEHASAAIKRYRTQIRNLKAQRAELRDQLFAKTMADVRTRMARMKAAAR